MTDEMLSSNTFTRPRRRPWLDTIAIKHVLTDEQDLTAEQTNAKGKAIAEELKICKFFTDEDIITRFESVANLDEFNALMDEMYDECDSARIWVA